MQDDQRCGAAYTGRVMEKARATPASGVTQKSSTKPLIA